VEEIDILKDILQSRISNQIFYNESMINIRNPEVRELFTDMRDDEMRSIEKLQQKVARLENAPKVVSRIFPSRPKY